jgi:hypothetical protein
VSALLLAPGVVFAQMYKCVDERGTTSYSDKPCVGAKGAQVDIHGAPPISGKLQAPSEDLGRAALQRRCTTLRQEQARLASMRRSAMDDQAREKRLAELQDQLRGCP